ncbi:DUF4957 domain-containing protein [Pontibacter silvestris]|uniref:DUF4957 domain-containing protein n=1 Tax=Pontibacter silvestris TaxID=2305183 RepID=A0ABW4WVY3_9BACT|nr:DUF4957 domain-containing protein [Pontibacter silvestris]MCC9137245.1 DUF4957 domain-containing protein [Pontibacter silvestris]
MKRILNKISHSLIPIMLLGLLTVACKEEIDELEPMRMFTPAGAISSESGVSQVKLTWNPSLYTTESSGVTYTVEVAADTLFETPVILTVETDTSGVVFTDDQLEIRKEYFARIKANALGDRPESHWVVSNSFRIIGEQIILLPIYSPGVKATSATLRWRVTPGITRVVVTPMQLLPGEAEPVEAGDPMEFPVTEEEGTAGKKVIETLESNTIYNVQIYAGNKSKGYASFTTKTKINYTIVLTPDQDLATAIQASADGDIIGLEPGEYDATSTIEISGKYITLISVSGDPADTKVKYKEFELNGEGAGVKFSGIDFDGEEAGASYFFNLTGGATNFKNFIVENSIVHHASNTILRGNRADKSDFKVDTIKFDNTFIYDIGESGSYSFLLLDEMEFKSLELTNSTFNNIGRQLISWATDLTDNPVPSILIDHCTITNFGYRNYPLLDANGNKVNFTMQNSILVNIPKPESTISSAFVRVSSSGSTINASYNNLYNLTNGEGEELEFPEGSQMTNNLAVNLGWSTTTTSFHLPASSQLRSASSTGGAIGDPRWLF